MSRLRLALVSLAVAVAVMPGGATGHTGPVLRGFGTAVIDANPAPSEWDAAGRYDFSVNRAAAEGGGTVPATLYVMNDQTNLYVALRVTGATVGSTIFLMEFDNDHGALGRPGALGDDVLELTNNGFRDSFFPQTGPIIQDTANGGTADGAGLDSDHSGFSFYELSHPLDTADNAHDFSLRPGARIGFDVYFLHCVPYSGCAESTRVRSGDIVAVSGSRIPPDTQLTVGPREGSWTENLTPTFEFTGSDDAIQPAQLTFECKLDGDAWRACTSPNQISVEDGRHTMSVRASDDMLNVDSTPAVRNWIVDTNEPSKPVIRGRRSVRSGQKVVLRFSATDALTPVRQLRFRCSVDGRRMRPCPKVYRVRLRSGRHQVRVRALDRVGYLGPVAKARITVVRARR